MNVLVLNCGSSSAKFAVIDPESSTERLSGIAQRLGSDEASLDWKVDGSKHSRPLPGAGHDAALRAVVALLGELGLAADLLGVGHRVVHGGSKFSGSMPLTAEVIAKVEECIPLGPLHNPPNLLGIKIATELLPGIPQVGVFDTAFHQKMPKKAYLYGIPYALYSQYKIRRYGFHGTSHRYVAERAASMLGKDLSALKLITCHLGNGCSMAAVDHGVSVDTSMGFTPLEGLLMGTRCGDIDTSIILYIMAKEGLTMNEAGTLLQKHSGLQGISGISSDMREIIAEMKNDDRKARYAFEVFTYRVKKYIGSYAAAMGGVDAVIFTGGIGENSQEVRTASCENMAFLGMEVDEAKNAAGPKERNISRDGSRTQVLVIPTNEELVIALDTAEIVKGTQHA